MLRQAQRWCCAVAGVRCAVAGSAAALGGADAMVADLKSAVIHTRELRMRGLVYGKMVVRVI
jgi:hypothetical protein